MAAHEWLCTNGFDQRLSMFPLFPHEVADDAEPARIAAAASDEDTPSPWPSVGPS